MLLDDPPDLILHENVLTFPHEKMLGLVGLQQQAMILDVCCVFFGGHHRLNVRVPRRCI